MTGVLVTLRDGRRVSNSSEDWRVECEARHVANLANRGSRKTYLDLVQKSRGDEARKALERAAREIFEADVAPRLRAAMAAQKEDDGRNHPEGIQGS